MAQDYALRIYQVFHDADRSQRRVRFYNLVAAAIGVVTIGLCMRSRKQRDVLRKMSVNLDKKTASFGFSSGNTFLFLTNNFEIPLNELKFTIEKNCRDPTTKGLFKKGQYWDEGLVERVKNKTKGRIPLSKNWIYEEIRIPIENENELKCVEYMRFVHLYHKQLDGLNFDSREDLGGE